MTTTLPTMRRNEHVTDYALRLRQAFLEAGHPTVMTRHEAARLIVASGPQDARKRRGPRGWQGDHFTPVALSEVALRVARGSR